MDTETLSYEQIFLYSLSAKSSGKLKLAQGGLGWKESATGQVTTLSAADFCRFSWRRVIRGNQLRVYLKNGTVQKFDGFMPDALTELEEFNKKNYQLPFEVCESSLKGWNWGKLEIDGNHLEFKVGGERMAFDLPLTEVTNVAVTAKDEMAIEFAQPENVDKKTDTIVEMRLYVPSGGKSEEDDDDENGNGDNDDGGGGGVALNEEEEGRGLLNGAKTLCERIKEFSEMNQMIGETIVSLPELPCIVPRGRFEMDMTCNNLRLHGKSYDHKILYSSIVKLFLLPKADETHVLFVLALDPPIRQGQTRYPFVVFQFEKDEEMEVDLQNIDEETLRTKYEGKLQMHYEAPTFEVVSTLFRLLAGQKIIVPGSFRNQMDGNSIKCALKANEGFLYPLERNFLFLPKPVTLVPHGDISHVEFARMGSGLGNPRSFDLKFFLKSGQDVSFSNIAKEEYQSLENFLKQKNIDFRSKDEDDNRRKKAQPSTKYDDEDDDEEDDEDGDGDGDSSSKRVKLDDNLDDSSPDEDYEGGDSSEGSSVGEEYDEEYNSDEDSNDNSVVGSSQQD